MQVVIFAAHCGKLPVLPPTSKLNLKGEGNKSGEGKHGWSDNGRRGMDGGIKGRGSASAPHEDPSNFSAVVLPKYIKHRPVSLGV